MSLSPYPPTAVAEHQWFCVCPVHVSSAIGKSTQNDCSVHKRGNASRKLDIAYDRTRVLGHRTCISLGFVAVFGRPIASTTPCCHVVANQLSPADRAFVHGTSLCSDVLPHGLWRSGVHSVGSMSPRGIISPGDCHRGVGTRVDLVNWSPSRHQHCTSSPSYTNTQCRSQSSCQIAPALLSPSVSVLPRL